MCQYVAEDPAQVGHLYNFDYDQNIEPPQQPNLAFPDLPIHLNHSASDRQKQDEHIISRTVSMPGSILPLQNSLMSSMVPETKDLDLSQGRGGSDDDEDLTLAQARRRAQNRTAYEPEYKHSAYH